MTDADFYTAIVNFAGVGIALAGGALSSSAVLTIGGNVGLAAAIIKLGSGIAHFPDWWPLGAVHTKGAYLIGFTIGDIAICAAAAFLGRLAVKIASKLTARPPSRREAEK